MLSIGSFCYAYFIAYVSSKPCSQIEQIKCNLYEQLAAGLLHTGPNIAEKMVIYFGMAEDLEEKIKHLLR